MDIVNYQLYGYPVMMYGMMLVTIGALTFATVGGAEAVGLSSVGNMLPSLPSASPEPSAAPAVFGAPPPPTPQQPASTTPVAEPVNQPQPAMSQGGKRKRNGSKRSGSKRSGSKRSGSKKNRTKKNSSRKHKK